MSFLNTLEKFFSHWALSSSGLLFQNTTFSLRFNSWAISNIFDPICPILPSPLQLGDRERLVSHQAQIDRVQLFVPFVLYHKTLSLLYTLRTKYLFNSISKSYLYTKGKKKTPTHIYPFPLIFIQEIREPHVLYQSSGNHRIDHATCWL